MFIVLEWCWHCHCTTAWTLDLQQHVRPKKNVVLTLITSSLVTLRSAPQHSCRFKVRELMTAAVLCSLKKWMFEKRRTKGRAALSAMAIICRLGEAGDIVVDKDCKLYASMNLLYDSFVSVNLNFPRDQSKYGSGNKDSQGWSVLFLLIYEYDHSCASHQLSRTDCWVQHYGKGPYAWLITVETLTKENPKVTSIPWKG